MYGMTRGGYGAPGMILQGSGADAQFAPMQLPKAVVRIGEQALWSAQQYADGATMARADDPVFTIKRGQTGQGFATSTSLAETNMREAGRIPGGYAYTVAAIACQAYYLATAGQYPIVGADVRNLVNNLVLQWQFLQTKIEIAPASLIGAGGGPYGATADTGANEGGAGGSRIMINNGNGQVWVYRHHPVALPSDATFEVLLTWGAFASVVDGGSGNSNMVVRVVLLGNFETAIAIG